MSHLSQLSFEESFWLILLLLQILGLYLWCWSRSRRRLAWFQPPAVLSVVFLYYTVFGPLHVLNEGTWIDRGSDLRYGFGIAWQGAAVAFASFMVGFGLLRQRRPQPRMVTSFDPREAFRLGRRLNLIGLALFALISGPRLLVMLNPLTARQAEVLATGIDLGPFANYAGLAINFLIPGILLMTACSIKIRKYLFELILWFIVAAGIYTTLGFRYRLALLLSGMLILWFLARGRQPKALLVIPSIIGLLAMAGFIGLTRSYGRGLDLSTVKGLGLWELVLAGFGESGVFLTSGGVMSLVPEDIPYAGITPLIDTLLFPIPSALLPGKNSAAYLFSATAEVYGSSIRNAGTAILNYAEYFLIGGWPVLIAGYVLLGWLCSRLWMWFLWRQTEPIAQVVYVCSVVYLYVIVSRGYLPQAVMLFAFTVLPLFFYYYRLAKPRVL